MNAALPRLAVTGSTGGLGGMVACELADAGVAQRLLARTPARAPDLADAVAVRCSYADRSGAIDALSGVQTLLMVSAAESIDRLDQHRAFVDAAQAAGVGHIVYTSFLGAAPDATFTLARDHYATEQLIIATGIPYTFLRDSLYIDFIPMMVGDDGVIRGPAGQGRASVVTRADIARSAAAILQRPTDHGGATYELTGPEALSMTDVAALMSAARGTTVKFHNETVDEAYQSRARWGAPGWQVDAWVSTYTAIAAGELERITNDVQDLTGRRPTSLAEFLREG
jgi:NAD(P)H dehydrogenase (quinone)